jgi:hypothetical protein
VLSALPPSCWQPGYPVSLPPIPGYRPRRFQGDLDAGRHILFVDVDPEQETALHIVARYHPQLVVRFQDKWSRFMELAP